MEWIQNISGTGFFCFMSFQLSFSNKVGEISIGLLENWETFTDMITGRSEHLRWRTFNWIIEITLILAKLGPIDPIIGGWGRGNRKLSPY